MYCQDVPSWKPTLEAGSAGPTNTPSASRARKKPVSGSRTLR